MAYLCDMLSMVDCLRSLWKCLELGMDMPRVHLFSLFRILEKKNIERRVDMKSDFFRGKQTPYQGHLCDSLN